MSVGNKGTSLLDKHLRIYFLKHNFQSILNIFLLKRFDLYIIEASFNLKKVKMPSIQIF